MSKRALIFVIVALVSLAGCKHKEKTLPPPQAQAPTVAPETQPTTPPPTTEPASPPSETTSPPTETAPATNPPPEPKPETPKPKPRRPTHRSSAKPEATKPAQSQQPAQQQPAQQASNRAQPVPGTSAPAADAPAPVPTPALPPDPVLHTRGTTDQLLQATEMNLRNLHRQLNAAEQGILDEIKNYMQRARSAQTDGDANLAHNYALKAHQLSDALLTPQ
jgi:outer membrane biosynthesis protein TonB